MIIVTSDHGNPMPRSKCNLYDWGARVPLAIRLPGKIPSNRKVDDFVGLWELAPTFLALAGVEVPEGMTKTNLWPVLKSEQNGQIDEKRDFIVTAIERHIICRKDGLGYPVRAIRTHKWAYIRNYAPDRWPAGGPTFNSSHQGYYGDVDKGLCKDFILKNKDDEKLRVFYNLAFAKRPAEELYDMSKDPHQMTNLANNPDYAAIKKKLSEQMTSHLKSTGDPRMDGKSPWDNYPFTDPRIFENPNWRTEGKKK